MNAINVLPDSIPAELQSLRQWVTWAYEPRAKSEGLTKIPYNPATSRRAKADDPTTWGTFDAAFSAYSARRRRWAGVGFEFAADGGLVGVDLDDCRNRDTGELTPWAVAIIERFNSYCEISPSGGGVKLWAKGSVPGKGTGRKQSYQSGAVEMYGRLRYFAVTGHRLPSAPAAINEAQAAIDWLWGVVFAKPSANRNAQQASHPQNAAMKQSSRKVDYAAAERQIMERVDVRREAETAGVAFAGDATSGWASCHAIGRDDATPSAGICLDPGDQYGRYKDHSASGKAVRFFEWMATLRGTDWRSIRSDYAAKLGVPLPSKNGKAKGHWLDKVKLHEAGNTPFMASLWAQHKPPIDGVTVVRAGGRFAKACGASCIAFFAHTPDDWSNPVGCVLYRVDGQDFPAYPPAGLGRRKTHVYGHDGLIIVGTVDDLQSAGNVLKCEGLTDALSIAPHLPAGWIAVSNICGASSFPRELAAAFAGKRLFVCGDSDRAGVDGSWLVAALSIGVASEVRRLELPYPVTDDHGRDLRDFVAERGAAGVGELLAAAESKPPLTAADVPAEIAAQAAKATTATAPPASGDDRRPTVEVTPDEHLVNDAAVAALGNDQTIFHRGGQLVRVIASNGQPSGGITRPSGAPRIGSLPLATLRERLAASVRFIKRFGSDEDSYVKPVHVPDFVCRAVASRGDWPALRALVAVVDSPTLRPDGTILDVPGWDESTGLLYRPNADFPAIPPHPGKGDAEQARDDLLAVVSDFPFKADEHKAAWLAFALTPLARHAFDGPAPLFLVDANVPGSGKSLLCDLVSLIVTGRPMPRMANPADDAEAGKLITSIALAGDTMVMIDNVAGSFGSPSLDAALTSTVWKGRILSKNETIELPLTPTWCASGNNVMLVGDIGRRICHVRLESESPNPEERQGFAHPDIKAWAVAERPRLIAAALTILRAYCVAGRPCQTLAAWGSFEGWSDLVRQAVAWVSGVDPGATRAELARQSDGEASILRQLLVGWNELQTAKGVGGMKAAAVLRELESAEAEWRERHDASKPDAPPYDALRTAISELCYCPNGKAPNSRSLANKLRRLKGRRVKADDDTLLYLDSKDDHGTAIWLVEKSDPEKTSSQIPKNNSAENPAAQADQGCSGCSSCSTSESLEAVFLEEREERIEIEEKIGLEGLEQEQLEQLEQPAAGQLDAEHSSPTPAPAAADRPPPAAAWATIDADTAAAAEFFLGLEAGDLPYNFQFGVGTITDPAKWLARMQADVREGPRGPRNRYGGLARELRELHAMLTGQAVEA